MKTEVNSKIKYSLLFTSLISPYTNNSLRFSNVSNNILNKKLLLKQSYLLLTWLYYLTIIEKKKNKIKFFILPAKKKTISAIKAPIAHKSNSKEHFKFQLFFIKVSFGFNSYAMSDKSNLDVSGTLLLLLLSKSTFPFFETNLFFLKNYNILTSLHDKKYFNISKFLLI